MKHHNTSSRTFLCKTLLVLLLLSSCAIKKQYYAYESEQKDEEGRPLRYYTLEHQSGRRFKTNIIRFSDLMTYNIFVMIEAGEDYTFFAWSVDTSSTRKPYYETRTAAMFKQTIFEKLYSIDAKKAIFRYKNNVEFTDKIFYETKNYLYKKDFNTFCEEIGLNMSTAINLFMRAVLREKRIPFELSLSNNETIQVFKDVKEGKNLSKSFSSVKELMEDLNA